MMTSRMGGFDPRQSAGVEQDKTLYDTPRMAPNGKILFMSELEMHCENNVKVNLLMKQI